MTRILLAAAVALVAFAPAAYAKQDPRCAAETKLIKATVSARQKGATRATMDKLADTLTDDAKARAHSVVAKIYTDEVFLTVPPQAAGAFFSATCQ
jgi:hypothetical protein